MKLVRQSTMQGVPNAMQGFSQNREPADSDRSEAATLEMREQKKRKRLSPGNVKVVQGDTTMDVQEPLWCSYDANHAPLPGRRLPNPKAARENRLRSRPQPPVPAAVSSIRRLEAKGSVVVTQKDQVVTGDTPPVFDTQGKSDHHAWRCRG